MTIEATSELTIGFAGLGNMGWPMAANLHAAGFALIARDADADRQARFAAGHPGVTAAAAPATSRPRTSWSPWAAALGELGPAADQSRAHQAWWADKLAPGSPGDR